MSPTSRNTLMIGGALILVALLLVCGPLSGQFGSGGSTVEEAPSVAAGPPVDAGAALGAAASGAMAGARIGEIGVGSVAGVTNDDPCARERDDTDATSGAGRDGADCPPLAGDAGTTVSDAGVSAGAVAAGTAVVAGATAAAVTSGGSGGGSGSASANANANASPNVSSAATPPPVSAGVPSTAVSALGGVPILAAAAGAGTAAAAASGAFDNAVASARNQNGGVGPAGRIVDRFPPPVAASSNSGMRVASNLNRGPLILPCDSPGSGCRNVRGGGSSPPGNLNPPIIPGGRPPGPTRNNPPIVPGARPPQIP